MICLPKRIFVYRGENAPYEFIKAILKDYKCCRKVMNKHFNKNLIMSERKNIYFNKVTVVGFVKNLFIDSMQFVNSSLHKLVKN